ncbi:MAG: hypothetical protein KDB80_01790, partial [Planctomycetes bacterium]|nr:hypothetical protein [Planctomycetota bacterium]
AFEEEHVGAVSEPIETERGYVLVAVRDLHRGVSTAYDVVDLVIVPFHTSDLATYDHWYESAQQSARENITFVQPDIEELLPQWLTPPRR